MELEKLIAQAKKKNRKAQSELFRRYKDALYLICLKYCRNQVDAEDNLHDSFITIFEKLKTYKGHGSFEGWMKRITIYKAIDKYKDKRPISIAINNDILGDTSLEIESSRYNLDTILRAIRALPDQYRMVFSLYELDNYSHNDIAKMLDIAEGTSKSNLHRAKLLLKQAILNEGKITEIRQNVS